MARSFEGATCCDDNKSGDKIEKLYRDTFNSKII